MWAQGGGAEEEGEQVLSRLLLSTEPKVGLDLITLRSQPELKPRVRCSTNCTIQAPLESRLKKIIYICLYDFNFYYFYHLSIVHYLKKKGVFFFKGVYMNRKEKKILLVSPARDISYQCSIWYGQLSRRFLFFVYFILFYFNFLKDLIYLTEREHKQEEGLREREKQAPP